MYDTHVQVVVGAAHRVLTWAPHLAQGHRLKMLWQKIMHCTPLLPSLQQSGALRQFFPRLKIASPGLVTNAELKVDKKKVQSYH